MDNIRNTIVTLRKENPNWTLRDIGELVHRTRERVRQILVSEKLNTRRETRIAYDFLPNPICEVCNKEIIFAINQINKRTRTYCDECVSNGRMGIAKGLKIRKEKKTIPCTYCNKLMTMTEHSYEVKQSKNKNMFCSASCRSRHTWQQQLVKNVGGRIVKVQLGRN